VNLDKLVTKYSNLCINTVHNVLTFNKSTYLNIPTYHSSYHHHWRWRTDRFCASNERGLHCSWPNNAYTVEWDIYPKINLWRKKTLLPIAFLFKIQFEKILASIQVVVPHDCSVIDRNNICMYVTCQFIKRHTLQVASRPLHNEEMQAYSISKIRMKKK